MIIMVWQNQIWQNKLYRRVVDRNRLDRLRTWQKKVDRNYLTEVIFLNRVVSILKMLRVQIQRLMLTAHLWVGHTTVHGPGLPGKQFGEYMSVEHMFSVKWNFCQLFLSSGNSVKFFLSTLICQMGFCQTRWSVVNGWWKCVITQHWYHLCTNPSEFEDRERFLALSHISGSSPCQGN